ncbi:MAG: dihydrofolate reductase, partial [Alistipes sp.]|nr:dihydrofolate reductase [Alistipes sp.]
MTLSLSSLCSCRSKAPEAEASAEPMPWIVDKFDDIKVLRYEVPGFEKLPLQQKVLIYYLAQATKAGRDILFDQNFKYNLTIRRTLEAIYNKYDGDRADANFVAMEKYLKKVWFANGIHHHYSNDKFRPEFSREWFAEAVGKYVDPQNMP